MKKKYYISNRKKSFNNSLDNLDDDKKDTITIEKMFKNYKGKPFKSELFEFKPLGREKW